MAFRAATSHRAGAGILGTVAVLLAAGLPTVVRYGTPGFPKTAKSWPANRGNLFAGGAGGTAKLVQQTPVTPNARYDIAGWLGGTKTSAAVLTVQFTNTSGRKPALHDRCANIGDLIASSGESWKAYLQSANGPCDDTVHGYYHLEFAWAAPGDCAGMEGCGIAATHKAVPYPWAA